MGNPRPDVILGAPSQSYDSTYWPRYPFGDKPAAIGAGVTVTTSVPAGSASGGETFSDGDDYELDGVNFGTNVPATNQAFFGGVNGPIEQAANGADIKAGSGLLPSGWTYPGSTPQLVSSARAYSGTKSILNRFGYDVATGGVYDSGNFQYGIQFDFGAPYRSLYTNACFYFDPAGYTSGQVKFQRFVGAAGGGIQDSDYPNVLFNQYGFPAFQRASSTGDLGNISPGGNIWVWNGWVRQEVFFVPGTSGGTDGSVQWRVTRLSDGVVIAAGNRNGLRFWAGADPAFRYWVIQGYIGNEFGRDGVQLTIDRDVFAIANLASSAFPRFTVIGDASTYSACDKSRLSVAPFTSWSNTRIGLKINKGAHANLIAKHLYVMQGLNSPLNENGSLLA